MITMLDEIGYVCIGMIVGIFSLIIPLSVMGLKNKKPK